MKKAVKINLSGQIFHIDEDAYDKLKLYLDTISGHFSNINESKEVLSDIEARIAELFRDRMTNENQVITVKEVDEIINILGRPEEIVDEDERSESQKNYHQRENRRLYRDKDNAVLGGVCSGLSAYLNLDLLVIRILFIIFGIFSLGIIVYLILWIAIPKAVTAAEKLEMKGEKVTISNIEKTVREEYDDVRDNLRRAKNSDSYRRTEDAFTRILRVLGTLFILFFKIVLGFVAFILILVGISILFGTFGFLFMGSNFVPFGHGDVHLTFPEMIQPFVNPENASALIFAGMLLVLIPILAIIYGLFKAIFRFKAKDRFLGMAGLTVWFLALIAVGMIVYFEGRNYQGSNSVTDSKTISSFNSDTLYLSMDPSELIKRDTDDKIKFNDKWYFDDNMNSFYGSVEINVRKSDNSEYKMRIEKNSRGRDNKAAKTLSEGINYKFTQKDSSIVLDPFYTIESEGKWRAQSVEVTLYVPEGKAVNFNRNTDDFIGWVRTQDNDWDIAGKTYIMKEDGLDLP